MADLRTLVARALQQSNYAPATSARVRAVPDTRTIRYYTTLGLIGRPAEMRGRTAFYDERHVEQLVAIKRLQAEKLTLSDIQHRLVGLTPKAIRKLAELPPDFWPTADRYLAEPRFHRSSNAANPKFDLPTSATPSPGETAESIESSADDATPQVEFWSQAAALPSETPTTRSNAPEQGSISPASGATEATAVERSLRAHVHPDVELLIRVVPGLAEENIDIERVRQASEPLLRELHRQGLLPSFSFSPETQE
ncbi:MAG: helix-turn-helix domain-containing protein [Rubripirellula sp.]